jgi:Grx4 family monothiol glutaredoxin
VWAQWHDPSVHLTKVVSALAADQPTVRFATANSDVCPSIANRLGADQVPFFAFLGTSGEILDSFGGADAPKLVEKVKRLAARPYRVPSVKGEENLTLNQRLAMLINYSPVMLFMKGTKDQPFCGFSRQVVEILNKYSVEYSTFNILEDNEVREGLKKYSDWKTYPQLYVKGELVGGLDIIKEMDADGSIAKMLPTSSEVPLEVRLKRLIEQAPVMVFMKGNPEQPRCGFSRKVCEELKQQEVTFETFDILSDEEVRQGLKTYANWSTYPQLYAQGKLVGGLDIIKELIEDGSLKRELGLEP